MYLYVIYSDLHMAEITIDALTITTTLHTGTKRQETIVLDQIAERIVAIIGIR
jgi:hypothetical protein